MLTPRTALPGLVKLYLASLYIAVALLTLLAVYIWQVLGAWFYSEISDYLPAFIIAAAAGLGLYNIVLIHRRSRTAPVFSRCLLTVSAVLGIIAGVTIFVKALDHYTPFGEEYASLWTALMQGLVMTAAWFLYWKRSPRANAAFAAPLPHLQKQVAPSLELMRLAAVYISVTGLCYSLTFVLYHSGNLFGLTANPGHWLLFGLPLTALLLFPKRITQKQLDWAGRLLILWLCWLACLSLVHLFFSRWPDLVAALIYRPAPGVPLYVEAATVIAMFWYTAWRSIGNNGEKSTAFWVRTARDANIAGVRGLDLLSLPLLIIIAGNIRPIYGQELAYYVYIATLGGGIAGSLLVLVVNPGFFITYMRYFTVGIPIIYMIRWGAIGLDAHGLSPSLLYALEWDNVAFMLLATLYFGLREQVTAHPALVLMRFVAIGCIALGCVMLMHMPLLHNIADDRSASMWAAANIGLPWLSLPFAAGLLYAGRSLSEGEGTPGVWFIVSAIGLIITLSVEKLFALFLYTLPHLPWDHALAEAAEIYGAMMPIGQGVAFALVICLWALSAAGQKPGHE